MHKKNTPARNSRLQKAKKWIPTYTGKNLARGYRKHFGVSMLCAVKELEMLGYEFTDAYKTELKRNEENSRIQNERRKQKRKEKEEIWDDESNEYFFYIAGYTEGGIPFGITWEEAEEEGLLDEVNQVNHEYDDLPF